MTINLIQKMKRTFKQTQETLESYELEQNQTYMKLLPVYEVLINSTGKTINFSTGINNFTIQYVINLIDKIIDKYKNDYDDETDDKLIITYIVDTPGGSVTSILKFVDYINVTRDKYKFLKYVSIITGMVASAGTIMCAIADTRIMTKNAEAMIHEISTGQQSQYTHFMSYSEHLKEMHYKLCNIYIESGFNESLQKLEELLKNETWLSPEKYLQYGLIDQIK
jgi:ATP-dependent protease ClpP protease subunit